MNKSPCLIKFFHAGKERNIKKCELENGICKWRYKTEHARKYVVTSGKYIKSLYNSPESGKIGFWCEWEAESYVKNIVKSKNFNKEYPRYLHIPLLPRRSIRAGYLNTDPCVIGKYFLYSNCMQNTKEGNQTHMQKLNIGDIIVFGSSKNKQFICDTVFVIGQKIQFDRNNMNFQIGTMVPKWYYNITLNSLNRNQRFTLYIGATYDNPVNGMFSFVPCVSDLSIYRGFIRPNVLTQLNNGKTQGTSRITSPDPKKLWHQIANEVINNGLYLGISSESHKFYSSKINIQKPSRIIIGRVKNE